MHFADGTLVGLLPGVRPLVLPEVSRLAEGLAAGTTHIWRLPGVQALVGGERRPQGELLTACGT